MGRKLHGWRKLAGSAWGPPTDPQFYGDLEVDAGSLLDFADGLRERTGVHVTMTHLVGRAIAHGLLAVPDVNVRLARGREFPRVGADVFFIVAAAEGQELTGVKVEGVDEKPVHVLATELQERAGRILSGNDVEFGQVKGMMARLPRRLVGPSIRFAAWLTSDLHLDLPSLGMRREAFGGAMVTSIGMWGINHAYSPLAAYYRIPVLVLVGEVVQKPVAVQGRVVVRPMLPLTATFDHRYVDGFHAARFAHAVRQYLEDPAAFEPAPVGAGSRRRRAPRQPDAAAPSPAP